jgi:uncharacterized OB-fold protein
MYGMRGLGADDRYWESLSEGRLELQQCSGCGKWNWPAVFRCGECGSWEHDWQEQAMVGTIYSWTRSWHDFGAPAELTLPYVSVVVELNGVNKIRLLGVLQDTGSDPAIGKPVAGTVRSVSFNGKNIPVIQWQLVQA